MVIHQLGWKLGNSLRRFAHGDNAVLVHLHNRKAGRHHGNRVNLRAVVIAVLHLHIHGQRPREVAGVDEVGHGVHALPVKRTDVAAERLVEQAACTVALAGVVSTSVRHVRRLQRRPLVARAHQTGGRRAIVSRDEALCLQEPAVDRDCHFEAVRSNNCEAAAFSLEPVTFEADRLRRAEVSLFAVNRNRF